MTTVSAEEVIHRINHAVTKSQRIHALQSANQWFHHKDERLHDEEIRLGSANALCLKLGYALLQLQRNFGTSNRNGRNLGLEDVYGDEWLELYLICSALSFTYGNSSTKMKIKSFDEIGASELLPLLLKTVELCQEQLERAPLRSIPPTEHQHQHQWAEYCNSDSQSSSSSLVVDAMISAFLVIRSFARLQHRAKRLLIDCDGGRLLFLLVSPFQTKTNDHYDASDENACPKQQKKIQIRIQAEALGVLKDLTFRGNDDDNAVIVAHTGLLDCVVVAASWQNHPDPTAALESHQYKQQGEMVGFSSCDIVRGREYASSVLWNFAISNDLRSLLCKQDDVLDVLLSLSMTDDDNPKIRKNAASALGNIASSVENIHRLRTYHNGRVISTLVNIAKRDVDSGARRRAMRTLRCVASGSSSFLLLENNAGLIVDLETVISDDLDADTRAQACETLGSIASSFCSTAGRKTRANDGETETMTGDDAIDAVIALIVKSEDRHCVEILCRALCHCLSEMDLSFSMKHDGRLFFRALEKVTVDISFSTEVNGFVASYLYDMSRKSTDSKIHMKCKSIFSTLSFLSSFDDITNKDNSNRAQQQVRANAAKAIMELATLEQNQKEMAMHNGLITSLVHFTMSVPEDSDFRKQAKDTIVCLVQLL